MPTPRRKIFSIEYISNTKLLLQTALQIFMLYLSAKQNSQYLQAFERNHASSFHSAVDASSGKTHFPALLVMPAGVHNIPITKCCDPGVAPFYGSLYSCKL